MSDTPRTDANYVCHYGDGIGQWVPREFACELERELAAALAQRDNEIQKRKEISEAIVKLFKYLRPYLTDKCQKLVDEADAAIQECGK